MSNSTTPSNKNGKKNGNVDKANKDKNPQSTPNATSDLNKKPAPETPKPSMPKSGANTAPSQPTNAASGNQTKSNEPTLSDKIVEVEPDVSKPTDKIVEVDPKQMKSAEDKVNLQQNDKNAKPSDNGQNLKPDDVKTADKKNETKAPDMKPSDKPTEPKQTQTVKSAETAKPSNLATPLSIIAIALVVALGAGLYYHGHSQSKAQQETIRSLEAQITALQSDVAGVQQSYSALSDNSQNEQILAQQRQLQAQIGQQQQTIDAVQRESASQLEQFQALQNKVSTLSTTEANLWLLAEADFLVKQATRKLNTEKDIVTAIALLGSADASIRDMNDPSLHELRNAIQHDITTLSSIRQVDVDGTVIKLHQLSEQLDKMALIRNQLEDEAVEPQNLEVSENISDWRENLSKSWKGFISDFVTVTPIDTTVSDVNKPELTANQGAYLRENIRLQLLIAAQAVPNYQQETYNQALAKAMAWTNEYYDLENPVNQGFIRELEQLQKQDIRITVPAQLSSQPLLNKQVETRLRSLLTQNAEPVGSEE